MAFLSTKQTNLRIAAKKKVADHMGIRLGFPSHGLVGEPNRRHAAPVYETMARLMGVETYIKISHRQRDGDDEITRKLEMLAGPNSHALFLAMCHKQGVNPSNKN